MRHMPGSVRDSIVEHLLASDVASLDDIHKAVVLRIGDVAQSSIRSYLNLNTPEVFERSARGQYRLRGQRPFESRSFDDQTLKVGRASSASQCQALM